MWQFLKRYQFSGYSIMHMVATPNYIALGGTNAKEKIAAMYKKKLQYIQYFVILVTGNWVIKVFLYQRNEIEFLITSIVLQCNKNNFIPMIIMS